ncbi:1,4-alpha-glucan branching protein domain-containing protein [Synechococcus sp. M16CYN]|uniref:glycoside hydrolase family 57 protein n=1 Tax=Synechococcus sp. M16CYN TaxID=3103139 RepID=UPI0030E473D7
MTKGAVALVLHAHLPYVRSAEPGSLEEDWFFQALVESYLPLLETLEQAANDPVCQAKLTISLSPTLLTLFSASDLKQRFPIWLDQRLNLLPKADPSLRNAADQLAYTFQRHLASWIACAGDLIGRFATLQCQGVVDLLTCGATHGYLPLLRQPPEAVRGQLRTSVREHQRLIGERPLGIWLPECAYYEGLDHWIRDAGLRYAVLDAHGLLYGQPRPRYGVYAPICSRKGVAFFGRDSKATLPVWSARDGYPGDPNYREFHRDLGWDLPIEQLAPLGLNESRPLSLKLHRVTNYSAPLDKKQPYNPVIAAERVKQHALEYLKGRCQQLDQLETIMDVAPLLVAPFDAELFGHWWFEGPAFLGELLCQSHKEGVSFTRLCDVLNSSEQLQLCDPCPSSWGQGGYHNYWLNDSNSWVIPQWEKAAAAMVLRCSRGVARETDLALLKQAARELLLAQSSDWSFILRSGTTTKLAKKRIERHLGRFWRLMDAMDGNDILPGGWLKQVQNDDNIFPLIQPLDWNQLPTQSD